MRANPLLHVFRAIAVAIAVVGPARAIDLAGTWHVLVHYTDRETANPDAMRWDDRIWVFEREGSRLRWTEYPIVVFADASGRFENLGTNSASRVLGAWEPNPEQLEQIRDGLEINERGSQSKSLRGSDENGWRSFAAMAPQSLRVLSYVETWSVTDVQGLPVFSMEESLSGGVGEALEGRSEYRTQEVSADGSELQGSFRRDENREGTFRMQRSGEVGTVRGSGKTQSERTMEMFVSQMGVDEGLATILANPKERGEDPERDREAVEKVLRGAIEQGLREQGMDPRRYQPEIDQLTRQILREWERGRSAKEIQRMIRNGKIKPNAGPLR